MPPISVIVPVYNVERYLCRCVDSLLAQTFTDFELILIDDDSPDACGAICDDYARKDSRVKVIHKQNGGVSAARNTGLNAAVGDYIAFCDSDDYVADNWLKAFYDAATTHNADVVIAGYTKVDEEGNRLEVSQQKIGCWDLGTMEDRLQYLLRDVLDKTGGQHGWSVWNRLFKADIIRRHDIHFCTTCQNYAEDQGFVLEYGLYTSKAVGIDYNGYRYVERGGSMMTTSGNRMKVNEANEVSVYFGERFFACVKDKRLQRLFALFHYLMMYQEYQKVVYTDAFSCLKEPLEAVENTKWYRRHTRKVYGCYTVMKARWDRRTAYRILLLSRYCLHKSWKRYCFESGIVYRWLLRDEKNEYD